VRGRARAAATRSLARDVEVFEAIGYRDAGKDGPLAVRLDAPDGLGPLGLRLAPQGRIFGGAFALEVSTDEPVLPATQGLAGRGRGVVRLARVTFRARRGDAEGEALARRLDANAELQRALAAVHFERIRVDPDGRAVVRHMGGSVVWVLFPPVVRPVPLTTEQARATAEALGRFRP
jgi:Protein of unknown function (DUF3156)